MLGNKLPGGEVGNSTIVLHETNGCLMVKLTSDLYFERIGQKGELLDVKNLPTIPRHR
jgi:hypothetical protein